MTPWPHGDPVALARAVLRDPRYAAAEHASGPSPWDTVWNGIGERLSAWLHALATLFSGHRSAALTFSTIVAVMVLCVIVLLAGWLVRTFFVARRRRTGERTGEARVAVRPASGSADLYAFALRAAARGAYRDATALLVRAAARALDERGRLADDRARTPLETARALHDPLYDAFAAAATPVLYAGDAADVVAWTRVLERAAPLVG